MGANIQPHLGQLIVELVEADKRQTQGMRSSEQLLTAMREFSTKIPGVNSIAWEGFSGGPGGKDIELKISGKNFDEVVEVSTLIKKELNTYQGVVDLEDNYDLGKQEAQIKLLESARPTGMTVSDLGTFVRNALYGAEARRITRNREDVKIMVRLPEQYRKDIYNLEALWVPRPNMMTANQDLSENSEMAKIRSQLRWIPIREVAQIDVTQGFTTIYRSAQERSITVQGDVDSNVGNLSEVMTKFRTTSLEQILKDHPSVRLEFLGTAEEQSKSFSGLLLAFPIALALIYMLIAGLFRSYFQPLVVMTAIPFGIQGAIIGHWVSGLSFTILSMIGMVALSGVVVNESIVLVDCVNNLRREGKSLFEASMIGARSRLRAILLTSITTVVGLVPLMYESSFQAKFLIPMAVTLAYGITFATVLTLVLVPCMNMILDDVIRAWRRFYRFVVGRGHNEDQDSHTSKPERVAVHS